MKRFLAPTVIALALAACSDSSVAPPVNLRPATASFAKAPIAGSYIVRFSDNEQDVDDGEGCQS